MDSRDGSSSIRAYDSTERVTRYDADMDIMQPLRHRMIDILLEVLPILRNANLRALDIGTGILTQRFPEEFPQASVVAIDGAEAMVDLARASLGDLSGRVTFRVADLRELPEDLALGGEFDDLEESEQDQPVALLEDLEIARSAGLDAVEVFWREYREVVYGGPVRKN